MVELPNLIDEYVRRHNLGVVSGDFSELFDLFLDDAVLEFRGTAHMVLRGKHEIQQAFERFPPTAQIGTCTTAHMEDTLATMYRVVGDSESAEGSIVVTAVASQIKSMIIVVA